MSRAWVEGERMNDERAGAAIMRELFIEELAQIKGGTASPWKKIEELLLTTYGQCEEVPVC